MATAVIPTTMPAMIDSHGNPGIAGNVIGVVTAAELDVVAVAILTTVVVLTAVVV